MMMRRAKSYTTDELKQIAVEVLEELKRRGEIWLMYGRNSVMEKGFSSPSGSSECIILNSEWIDILEATKNAKGFQK
jgi:hypothetical protein